MFTLDGQLKSSTGRKGSRAASACNWPSICAPDDAGAALIADSWNSRLQLLNVNSQRSILELQLPVKEPYNAYLVNGTHYVNDF